MKWTDVQLSYSLATTGIIAALIFMSAYLQ